ncbi:tail fiber domain-containing protein [Candidatus Zixiibacteriota bacterium]
MRFRDMLCLSAVVILLGVAFTAQAGVPELMNYQGILLDSGGDPVVNPVDAVFTIYDDSTGGNPIWTETRAVSPDNNGRFNILLGEAQPLTDTTCSWPERWLGIAVAGDPEMQPRVRLATVPYSFRVSTVDGADGGVLLNDVWIEECIEPSAAKEPGEPQDRVLCPPPSSCIPAIVCDDPKRFRVGDLDWSLTTHRCGRICATDGYDPTIQLEGGTGDIIACGKATIGPGHVNDGDFAFNAGCNNTIDVNGDFAAISGGRSNIASAYATTIGGGESNQAQDMWATVAGGIGNTSDGPGTAIIGGVGNSASGVQATVGAGINNAAHGHYSSILGGYENVVGVFTNPNDEGRLSAIGGGYRNTIEGKSAAIAGGSDNIAWDNFGAVGGGYNNEVGLSGGYGDQICATVGGGRSNMAQMPYSTIGGGESNVVAEVHGTIGGGRENQSRGQYGTIGGGDSNTVALSGVYGTIGGGVRNQVSAFYATIGGGDTNQVTGDFGTIGGGAENEALGNYSTVPGGVNNIAEGDNSLAAGTHAIADSSCSFVWSDCCPAPDEDFRSRGSNTFNVRAHGGIYFYTSCNQSTGVYIDAGGNSWNSISDRATKENFTPIDGQTILDKLAAMPINEYNIKAQDPSIRHIGPVAQDFFAAFGCGESDRAINMEDADGIALVAIQGLYQQNLEQQKQIAELKVLVQQLLAEKE